MASLSNYELGRRFWHQQDYQRSLEAVEHSIALKLFPYQARPNLAGPHGTRIFPMIGA